MQNHLLQLYSVKFKEADMRCGFVCGWGGGLLRSLNMRVQKEGALCSSHLEESSFQKN
jgi:hypothetical protein